MPADDGTLRPRSCQACPPRCDNPFDRLVVSYLIRGGTRVMWELRPDFLDPRPHIFQLQVGQTDNQNANDWTDVGGPVTDVLVAVDGEQRVFGKLRWQFYRVQMTTPVGSYVSDPAGLNGVLSWRDWRIARELMRQELVRMRQFAGQTGYLLKRRITGTYCPVCTDPQTREIRDPFCPVCWGTGFLCGYFYPVSCVWAEIDPKTYRTHGEGTRGTIDDVRLKARMANIWLLSEEDVWVNKRTDDRYYVHAVQHLAEVRGVPIVAAVELRPAPFTDPIYGIEIPEQLESVDQMTAEV